MNIRLMEKNLILRITIQLFAILIYPLNGSGRDCAKSKKGNERGILFDPGDKGSRRTNNYRVW